MPNLLGKLLQTVSKKISTQTASAMTAYLIKDSTILTMQTKSEPNQETNLGFTSMGRWEQPRQVLQTTTKTTINQPTATMGASSLTTQVRTLVTLMHSIAVLVTPQI